MNDRKFVNSKGLWWKYRLTSRRSKLPGRRESSSIHTLELREHANELFDICTVWSFYLSFFSFLFNFLSDSGFLSGVHRLVAGDVSALINSPTEGTYIKRATNARQLRWSLSSTKMKRWNRNAYIPNQSAFFELASLKFKLWRTGEQRLVYSVVSPFNATETRSLPHDIMVWATSSYRLPSLF